MIRRPPRSTRTDTLFPYTTLFRSDRRVLVPGPAFPRDLLLNVGRKNGCASDHPALRGTGCLRAVLPFGEIDGHLPKLLCNQLVATANHRDDERQRKAFGRSRLVAPGKHIRSEDSRVGKECVSTFKSRGSTLT